MARLDPYLSLKKAVLAERREDFTQWPDQSVVRLSARSGVAGNTGVRPTHMGDHYVASDSAPGLAGHSLGPSSPEMLLGALASCLVHTYLLQATLSGIPLDDVEVEVSGALDMAPVVGLDHGGTISLEGLRYHAEVASPASTGDVERLHEAVERTCAVLNTLRAPMAVKRV